MDLKHLVKQCQNGDKEACGLLYQTYLVPMRQVVAYYVHDPEAVSDILHDGFLIAFVSIDSLKDAAKIRPWLTSIMKNLALQYLKDSSGHISVPFSELQLSDISGNDSSQGPELTWEELDTIISQLPEGYGKVFRLAVLDGMSHKEIGSLLGIAPHSSSSQLTHAKAMMRRMITKYKVQIGALSVVALVSLVWHGLQRHRCEYRPDPVISDSRNTVTTCVPDSIADNATEPDSTVIKSPVISRKPLRQFQDNVAEVTVPQDSLPTQPNENQAVDSITSRPHSIIDLSGFMANEDLPAVQPSDDSHDWALSLAYSGNLEQNDINRYGIFVYDPDAPNAEGPSDDDIIEVTETTHHYMPLVAGLSLNKSLTSRWSIETGLRYTLLRSDFKSESILKVSETVQRIHYIGLSLKFNYRIFTYGRLSLYGQGGGALDVPLHGRQRISEYSPVYNTADTRLNRIHAPLQWSAEGGLGIQYHLSPVFSIYAEPSARYYFNPGSDIKTIRSDKPFEFTIPIGARLTW